MKKLLAIVLPGLAICLAGCAENDTSPARDVTDHFQRGLSGEGQIGPIDRSNDPYIRPRGSGPLRP